MQVNFYEGPPFKFKGTAKSHERFPNCVRYSPDGQKFFSVGSDQVRRACRVRVSHLRTAAPPRRRAAAPPHLRYPPPAAAPSTTAARRRAPRS